MKTLEILKGTEYRVEVTRDITGGYDVSVYKPALFLDRGKFIYDDVDDMELIGMRYLDNHADEEDLVRVVGAIIDNDKPSIVGTYVGGKGD